jgi:GNAT superfamily N-acetyltransferase
MNLSHSTAVDNDALAIASLLTATADHLTHQFGRGHWSSGATENGVLRAIKTSRLLVARSGVDIIATLRLATKKPWAIDTAYFEPAHRPLYLVDMAVDPGWQRQGIGRSPLEYAKEVARAWPGDAIRLDAYDSVAGAGPFYARCGFREVGRVTYRHVPLVYFEALL